MLGGMHLSREVLSYPQNVVKGCLESLSDKALLSELGNNVDISGTSWALDSIKHLKLQETLPSLFFLLFFGFVFFHLEMVGEEGHSQMTEVEFTAR